MACKYIFNGIEFKDKETFIKEFLNPNFINQPKTLRLQEFQSDWAQKLRLNFEFNGVQHRIVETSKNEKEYFIGNNKVTSNVYQKAFEEFVDKGVLIKDGTKEQNDFARLIFKSWETFGINAVIQNAAKKGYEKVLFPVGDTAAKIEGHETVEEFIRNKESRKLYLEKDLIQKQRELDNYNNIKLSSDISEIDLNNDYLDIKYIKENGKWYQSIEGDINYNKEISLENVEKFYKDRQSGSYNAIDNIDFIDTYPSEIRNITNEIQHLEKEIEDAKAGKLKISSIANFYETTIFNILKKQGYNPEKITDEYGNDWYEIEIISERDQQAILLQITKDVQKVASSQLIKLMKEFIKQIGVDYKLVENIVVKGKKQDANGVALIMQKLIQVVEGKEEEALPEEAMHFAVEIIKQTNSKLYQQLLKEINTHPKLQEVITIYGNHPAYQLNGKRNFLKLKEEAIAQVLVDNAEDMLGKSWMKKILDYLKDLFFGKSGIDIATMNILSGKLESIDSIDVSKAGNYFQLSKGETVFNNILDVSNQIISVEETDKDGKIRNTYQLDDVKATSRVSDFAKRFYESIFGTDINKSEFEKAINDLKAERGTFGHSLLEEAFKSYVDITTGLIKEEESDDNEFVSNLSSQEADMYFILKNNLKERIYSFPKNTRFLSEIKVFDKKRKIGGMVDFIAITSEGKVNILDWKFIDLNTEKYEDIPWYKVKAWNIQMDKYKDVLSTNYNIPNQDFQQTRMIPILASYTPANYEKEILPRLKEVRIGDVNVQNIEEDYLLPVGITNEKTGNKIIDNLIEKFNNVYEKLATEKVKENEKQNKAEQLNALYKAIRHLQIKTNIIPLLNQAKILNKQVSILFDRYKKDFEGKDNVDPEEINAFSGMIRIHLEALQPYLELDQLSFIFEENSEENNKLELELLRLTASVKKYINELESLDSTFGEQFNSTSSTPEKVVKGIGKWFSNMSTIQVNNIQSFYKLANKAFAYASQDTLSEVKKLTTLKNNYQTWANSKGLNLKNQFDIILKKNKNELIDQYNRTFYDELKKAISKKDFKWIKENIDISSYSTLIDQKIEEELSKILSKIRIGSKEQVEAEAKRDIAKMYAKYNLEMTNSNGWFLEKLIKKYPKKDIWESEEWKELNKKENSAAKDFYDYIVERNFYYQSIGYLNGKSARKFLPWIRKGFVEGLVFGNNGTKLGEQFLKNISLDEADSGYGQVDPITGELINSVPKYFVKDLGEDYSTDLFKTISLYNEYAIKFKNLTDIEERSLQLLRIERNKKSIMTSTFGSLLKDENNELKLNPNNIENSKLLEDMIKGVVYGQKYIESEAFDIALGKISGFGKKINEKLGFELLPENLSERQLSLNKVIDTINTQFQLNSLGLNPLSAISNLFGGTINGLINSGKYFTKSDFAKTQLWMLTNKMSGGQVDAKKAIAALDYFTPFVENYNKHAARKLSLNKFDEQAVQEFLMIMMRNGEEAIQKLNFYTFIKNEVVVNNKIVNAREYLRKTDEYKNFYSGTQQERNERKNKFEKDVTQLIEEKGVLVLGEIINDEFVIPNVNKKDDSVIEFRRLVQSFTSDALGSMSDENRRLANMNVYSASAMVFKNWIPRLVDVRVGNLKYNAGSDAYEWGRMRMIINLLTTDFFKSSKSLKSAILGDGNQWIEQVKSLYEKKKLDYLNSTGKELKMTEDEFISLVNQNIKNQILDTTVLLSMISLLAGLKALAPDDDEDPIVKNQWKFLVKATDKLTDELLYFYNPSSIHGLISTGFFPSLSLLENYSKFLSNFLKENFGIITENEKMQDDATPIKYLMRSFPISNQAIGYLPMFYPELAKDLDIKMQGQYGIR